MSLIRQVSIQDGDDSTKKASVDVLGNLRIKQDNANVFDDILIELKINNAYLAYMTNMEFKQEDLEH